MVYWNERDEGTYKLEPTRGVVQLALVTWTAAICVTCTVVGGGVGCVIPYVGALEGAPEVGLKVGREGRNVGLREGFRVG